jgi:hypothetical protein
MTAGWHQLRQGTDAQTSWGEGLDKTNEK